MARLGESLDTQTTDRARDGFIEVPPGYYLMQIVANEEGDNKGGTGKLLKLRWQVIEGEFENQYVFQQINYIHQNHMAQTIGQGQLMNICDAVGFVGQIEDADVLMHVPCRVTVGWSKPQAGYDKKPEVKSVKPYAAAAPQQTQQRQAVTVTKTTTQATTAPKQATAAPAGGARPWQARKAG